MTNNKSNFEKIELFHQIEDILAEHNISLPLEEPIRDPRGFVRFPQETLADVELELIKSRDF